MRGDFPRVALVLGLAMLALASAALLVAQEAQAEGEPTVAVPVDCGKHFCVLPRAALEAVFKNHNAAIDEIRRLEAELAGRGRTCPGDKGA